MSRFVNKTARKYWKTLTSTKGFGNADENSNDELLNKMYTRERTLKCRIWPYIDTNTEGARKKYEKWKSEKLDGELNQVTRGPSTTKKRLVAREAQSETMTCGRFRIEFYSRRR